MIALAITCTIATGLILLVEINTTGEGRHKR